MTGLERVAWTRMLQKAVNFAVWAAGEGIRPACDQSVEGPEDFLFDFSQTTGMDDWDQLPEITFRIIKNSLNAPQGN